MSRIGFTITIVLLVLIGLGPLIKGHFLNRNDPPSVGDQFHLATLAYEAEQYEDAYRIMHALAKAGDANAQFNLGFLYTWGRGVRQDDGKVINWYRCAAEQGDAEAQLTVGTILLANDNEQTLAKKEMTSIVKSTEQSVTTGLDPRNQSTLQTEGLYWLRRAAEQGNPEAQYGLGDHFMYDDPKAAMQWFRLAANQDHDNAQFELGEIYRQEKGIPPGENYVEAAIWYLLAAERGNVLAQAQIGEMFYNGDGVQEDFAKAYMWLNLAVGNLAPGFEVLQKRLIGLRDTAFARLSREQIIDAQRQSSRWHARPSTANQVAEWRPRSAVARLGDSEMLAVPNEYSHCEMQ